MIRTIIEENELATLRDGITLAYPRTEDAWLGLTWLIARTPEVGSEIGLGTNVRIYKQQEVAVAGAPMITALYKYDDKCVNIIEAKFDSIHDVETLQKTGSEDPV